jgi:hypothetical protein
MGVVLLATLATLALPTGPAVAVTPTSAVAASAQPTLRTGSHGAVVIYLQRRLATLHYPDNITAWFEQHTGPPACRGSACTTCATATPRRR